MNDVKEGQVEETAEAVAEAPAEPALKLVPSRQFPNWLGDQRASLAFTTYQAGKVFFIGLQADGRLSIHERSFPRCMGMCVAGPRSETLWLSSLYQLWRFENAIEPGDVYEGYDRLYVPQLAYTTGDIDIHDITVDSNSRVVFVNTLFGCLSTVSETHSFTPLWKPDFVTKLAAEDRCHLNGLATEGAKPRYVTAISQSNITDGWRDRRHDGGVVVDVATNEIVVSGLSMPHSPRMHDGRLWLLNSGTGYFGSVDVETGEFEPLTFCPGYLRGLVFVDHFAVVGLSKPRRDGNFSGLALDDNLVKFDAEARCGLMVIDLKTGDIVHWLRIEGLITELYDVVALPGVIRPMALGLRTDEIRRTLSVDEEGTLFPH